MLPMPSPIVSIASGGGEKLPPSKNKKWIENLPHAKKEKIENSAQIFSHRRLPRKNKKNFLPLQ